MEMLIDRHFFKYHATVPWPVTECGPQINWVAGVELLEIWLQDNVGTRPCVWAWNDGQSCYQIGVAFKWEQHRSLFLLKWA